MEMAYNLNVPMPVKRIGKQKGCGEEYDSFLHCDKESCFIEVIKKAEDGDGVIVRMYENKNNRVRAHITSGRALANVTFWRRRKQNLPFVERPLKLYSNHMRSKHSG